MKLQQAAQEGLAALLLRLRGEGSVGKGLLNAVEQTPRTLFAPFDYQSDAFSSRMIPLDCGSFMEGADMAVRMIAALDVRPGHRVLEVGTGSGFTAAVMGRVVERVLTIDRYRTLVNEAQKNLEAVGLRNVIVRHADGSQGLAGEGTFDRILVTAAFSSLPRALSEQIVSGGALLVPIMLDDERCRMVRVTRTGSRFDREDLFEAPYLPIVPKLAAYL
ncbi:protein-L-isoaspartate(D-aspartate) O-methyltransferase [Ensifer soli]|uniref:protein-L-isoaspartate(D-aspartate) O-methyltransferase n=1 Tax=Ciceribacter sp. sgz301302 TaxID=3342379 RepID=UPI0035B9271A